MAISNEAIVIGGGFAGLMAAITAARRNVDVRVVSAKESTLQHASGLVDVLGYTPAGRGPLVNPFDAITDLPPEHPYTIVGDDTIRDGLELFDEVTGDRYLGDHTPKNALYPTFGGTVKPTARYPRGVAHGNASDPRSVLLVGFKRLTGFDAPLAADHLDAAGVPFDVRGVTIEFPVAVKPDTTAGRYAHLLEIDRTDDRAVTGIRTALADRVRRELDGELRIGFPAVLGRERHPEVLAALEIELDAAVFEVPMGPPSLPGKRLEGMLTDALTDSGGKLTTGNPVVDYEAASGTIRKVYLDKNGQHIPYEADRYVLATGGLVGRGVESDRTSVREPIFDCHIPHPEDRYDWFDNAAFGDHPFARFGVPVDEGLRPCTETGEPEFSNLYAAGSVLGGYDFPAEKSGSGVSIATGVAAGRAVAGAG